MQTFKEFLREKYGYPKWVTINGKHVFLKDKDSFDYDKLVSNKEKKNKVEYTKYENDAIFDYTTSKYKDINDHLRNGKNVDAKTKNIIKNMDSAMEKSVLKNDIDVYENKELYRAASIKEINDAIKNDELKPGFIFKDKGYSSTTKSKSIANGFLDEDEERLFVIHLKNKNKAIDVGDNSNFSKEEEVIIARNTTYKVRSVEIVKEKKQSRSFGGKLVTKTIKVEYIHLDVENQD